jgi:hypothetical protein
LSAFSRLDPEPDRRPSRGERVVIVGNGREVLSATMLPPPVMVTAIGRRLHQD